MADEQSIADRARSAASRPRDARRRRRASSTIEPAFALADGSVLLGEPDAARRVVAHPGRRHSRRGFDGKRLMTGGDDGRVVATNARRRDERDRRRERPLDRRAWRCARRSHRLVAPGKQARSPRQPPAPSDPGARRRRCAGCACCPKATVWRSPITTASRCGSRTSRPSRPCSSGRARIST